MMRIAMIGQRGVPARGGGVERVVEELGAELVELGHEVTVYCRNPYTDRRLGSHRGMRLVHAASLDSKHLEAISHAGVSAARSLREKFDVVHFHALGPGLVSPLVRYGSNAKVVQTVHGLDDQRQKWGLVARTALSAGGSLSARIPDATIVLTEDLRRYYRWQRGRHVVTIPNGVRPAEAPADWRQRLQSLGLEAGSYALSVGRLVPEKAFDHLVDTFSRVDIGLDLVVVGGSSHTDTYAQSVRMIAPHDQRLSFVGSRESEDLASIYRGAAMFVTASRLEGMPLVVLEAVSHGLPIVASDIAPHREVLGEQRPGRRFFKAGDSRALEAAMVATVNNLDAEREAAQSDADRTIGSYSWRSVAVATEAVYERVIDGAPAAQIARDSLAGGLVSIDDRTVGHTDNVIELDSARPHPSPAAVARL